MYCTKNLRAGYLKKKKPEKWRLLLLRIDGPKRSTFFFQFSGNICLNNTIGRAILEAYCNFYLRTKKVWSVWTISMLSSDRVRLPCTQHKSFCWRNVTQPKYVPQIIFLHFSKQHFLRDTKQIDIFATNNQTIPVAGTIYDAQGVNRLKPSSSK